MLLHPRGPGPSDYQRDLNDRLLSQPAELAAAGVKFAIGSFDNSFARHLGQQAANAVAHGLPYEEALKAVTLYLAQILGVADQVGTLESGKIANVIVTTGDPLELTTDVKYLFIDGHLTPPITSISIYTKSIRTGPSPRTESTAKQKRIQSPSV